MTYAAILFDLDGTLVDSIDIYSEAVKDMFAAAGIQLPLESFRDSYGKGLILKDWLVKYGVGEDQLSVLRPLRDQRYIALLREKIEWLDGASGLLTALKERHPLGLITGSWQSYVDAIDSRLQVSPHFQTVVTADNMGDFMKPHPHGLLLAADRLGVEPEQCIYIGDQLFDIDAAKNAGMKSCCLRGTYTPKEAVERADFVVETLEEVERLV